jgi:hypothetical protein
LGAKISAGFCVLNDVGNAEGLARPGDSEQHLTLFAAVEPAAHLLDGPRLIAARHEV